MVEGEGVLPFWLRDGDGVVPEFCLGAGVNEDERGLVWIELFDDIGEEAEAEVTCPGDASGVIGND